MNALMAELYGRSTGCCRGRGGSMHIFDVAQRFYGGNAIVGGGLPLAAGLALAERMQKRDGIVACFFGEGAAAEGEFHETLNLAALWRLPVLFLCENNRYAMGTALERSESQTNLCTKVASYGIDARPVDGMDVFAVADAANAAAARVRAGGPAFLELHTYRFRGHSMFDAQLYRDRSEVAEWQRRGPLITFTTRFKETGLVTEEDYQRLVRAADAEVDAAVAFAERSPLEPVSDLLRWVHAETTP
jgi:pyruvate dehydrogenase E1 component alpha subunit